MNPRDRRKSGEFGVSLIENNGGVRRSVENLAKSRRLDQRAGGIVGIGEKKDTRFFAQRGEHVLEREVLLRIVAADRDARAGNLRVIAIHRKSWFADQNMGPRLHKRIEEDTQSV